MITFHELCAKYPTCNGCPLNIEAHTDKELCFTLYCLCKESDGILIIDIQNE